MNFKDFEPLTFKELIKELAAVKNGAELEKACTKIDWSFQKGKITFKDSELLFKLVSKINF